MYQLICTSYTETEQGLVLRNNWIEAAFGADDVWSFVKKWQLSTDFQFPGKCSISNVLHGKMEIDNVIIHVRIVHF